MGQVTGVIETLLQLVLIGLAAALLLQILWSVLGVRLPLTLRPVTRTIARRTQWLLGPLHQTVLCVLAALLVGLVLAFPRQGPWAPIMEAGRSTALSTQMLAGAAALLVLLTFAATQAKTAEAAAQGGRTYLGHVMPTYRFLRSPWTRLTRQLAFQVLVVALFAIPLVLTIIPESVATSTTELLVQGVPRLDDLLTALWCSAFALVGTILIMHLVSSIRTSLLETSRPNVVTLLIRWDLVDESALEWKELLTASTRRNGTPRDLREWTQHHAATAQALPPEERTLYAQLTLGRAATSSSTQRLLERGLTDLDRAARAEPALATTMPRTRLENWWRALMTWWRVDRRRARAQRRITAFEDAHRALVGAQGDLLVAIARADRADAPTTSFGRSVTQSLLFSGTQIDVAHDHLRSHGATALADSLLTPEHLLPDESRPYIRYLSGEARSPQVLTLTATVLRDIARAAYSPVRRTDHPVTTGYSLDELLSEARWLTHQPTRIFALDEILGCFIRGVVIDGSKKTTENDKENDKGDGEEDGAENSGETDEKQIEDPVALRKVWDANRPGPSQSGWSGTGDEELATQIERIAFNQLTGGDKLTPMAKSHLLSVLPSWRPPCALLHELLYARRSGRSLAVADLEPYATVLRHRTPRDPDELEELEKRTLEVIRNPGFNTSHFTQDAGISWLVRALGERLTPALCGEFAERTRTFEIQELRLLDFVQWHLVAGEGLGAVSYGDGYGDPAAVPEELRNAAADLWRFCDQWEDVDTFETSRLRTWLFGAVGPDPREEPTSS